MIKKNRNRHAHELNKPPLTAELSCEFEKTLSIINPDTDEVLGYITTETARDIAAWVKKVPQ